MAASVNKVILVGNLGKDPEVRTTQSGTKIVNFSLATSETWNDKASGERKERTEWHRVVIFNERIADVAEKYLHKGSKVYVDGCIRTRKWTDQSGQEKYSTEVTLENFRGELVLLDSKNGEQQQAAQPQGQRVGRNGSADHRYGGPNGRSAPAWDAPKGGDLDDEIPF